MKFSLNKPSDNYLKKLQGLDKRNSMPLSIIVKCFVGSLIKQGNKIRAQRIFVKILINIFERKKQHPLYIIQRCFLLLKPNINLVTRKRGQHTFQIPSPITRERAFRIAIHWLFKSAKKNTGSVPFIERVTSEILNVVDKKPNSLLTIRSEIHKGVVTSRVNFKRLRRFVTSINKLSPKQKAQYKWRKFHK